MSNGPVPRSDRFPGWDAERWGYHGGDGLKFASSGSGTKYGEKYGTGDTLGCCVNSERRMFFTKNGRSLGNTYFYPLIELILIKFHRVCIRGCFWPVTSNSRIDQSCRIHINFSEPFVYDLQTKIDIVENKQTTAS